MSFSASFSEKLAVYFQISIYTWVVMKLTSHAGEFVCLFPCLLLVFAGERYFKKHAAKQGTFSMGLMEHTSLDPQRYYARKY